MSFGMFPIVKYTGYAVLLPNNVICVQSVDIIKGTMVAPGFEASRVV